MRGRNRCQNLILWQTALMNLLMRKGAAMALLSLTLVANHLKMATDKTMTCPKRMDNLKSLSNPPFDRSEKTIRAVEDILRRARMRKGQTE